MQFSVLTTRGLVLEHDYKPDARQARRDLMVQLRNRKENVIGILLAMHAIWPNWTRRLHKRWAEKAGWPGYVCP